MPNFVFLLLAGDSRRHGLADRQVASGRRSAGTRRRRAGRCPEAQEASWADVTPLDVLGLEVGYRLIPLVDKSQDGELLQAHPRYTQEICPGSGLPGVAGAHPRQPGAETQRLPILLKGVEIGEGEAFPGNLPGDQSRPSGRPGGRHCDQGSGLRPAGRVDRRRRCANRRRPTATRWSTPAPSSQPISTIVILSPMPPNSWGVRKPKPCSTIIAKDMPKLVEDLVPKAAAARRGAESAAEPA
jgi:flagellar biosynthesis protein FlhA